MEENEDFIFHKPINFNTLSEDNITKEYIIKTFESKDETMK